MEFNGFKIHSFPQIIDAYCKKCGELLKQVSNGWISSVMFCIKCENVYELKLMKVAKKKIGEDFLMQCRQEVIKKKEEMI